MEAIERRQKVWQDPSGVFRLAHDIDVKPIVNIPQTQHSIDAFVYTKRDLQKTLVLTVLAFSLELCLYWVLEKLHLFPI